MWTGILSEIFKTYLRIEIKPGSVPKDKINYLLGKKIRYDISNHRESTDLIRDSRNLDHGMG